MVTVKWPAWTDVCPACERMLEGTVDNPVCNSCPGIESVAECGCGRAMLKDAEACTVCLKHVQRRRREAEQGVRVCDRCGGRLHRGGDGWVCAGGHGFSEAEIDLGGGTKNWPTREVMDQIGDVIERARRSLDPVKVVQEICDDINKGCVSPRDISRMKERDQHMAIGPREGWTDAGYTPAAPPLLDDPTGDDVADDLNADQLAALRARGVR